MKHRRLVGVAPQAESRTWDLVGSGSDLHMRIKIDGRLLLTYCETERAPMRKEEKKRNILLITYLTDGSLPVLS